jgi:hypothetical protein
MNFLRRQRLLVIVDEFQSLVNTAGRLASEAWARAFQAIRPIDPCRILLLSSQSLDRGERWLEGGFHNSLRGFERTEGAALLGTLLAKRGRGSAVQEDKLGDVSDWLGGIPRAIEMLVAELEYTSLEEAIQWEPDSWELRDGGASSEFLRRFEERILERALSRLGERERVFLRRLAVLREPSSNEVTQALAQAGDDVPTVIRALVDRMLLQRQPRMGYYAMVPVVRHSVLLNISDQQRLAAHTAAGGYYAKPFFAANTLGKPASLAAKFREARYHFYRAENEPEMKRLAESFSNHLELNWGWTTPLPKDADERDERIVVLSALLIERGRPSLEYHLARLLVSRSHDQDWMAALPHARRCTGSHTPHDA